MKRFLVILGLLISVHLSFAQQNELLSAELKLPTMMSSNMVIQRNSEFPIWGWGEPGKQVKILTSWNQKEYVTVCGQDSVWKVFVKTPDAGGPYTIQIQGKETIVLDNVLSGDVWFCCGQSNMEWSMKSNDGKGIPNVEAEAEAGNNYPNVRFFFSQYSEADTLQEDNPGSHWEVCDSNIVQWFSAVGQFFARELNEELEIPIGMIGSYWGGTSAEVWTPAETVNADPELKMASKYMYCPPEWNWPTTSGVLYNAMIYPWTKYPISGAIWYQGESNAVTAPLYSKLMTEMISDWRSAWKNDFPFYIIQISPYDLGNEPTNVLLREQELKITQTVKNTGLVVISDVGDAYNIHPQNKRPVGERLCWLAMYDHYKDKKFKDFVSPEMTKMKVKKNQIEMVFSHAGEGLEVRGHEGMSKYFQVAGADMVFHPAQNKISGNKITIWSDEVAEPVAVRYAWHNIDFGDVFNSNGLPMSAFRTDDLVEYVIKEK